MDRPAADTDTDVLDELTSLADELLAQASEVRRQWAELSEALGAPAGPGAPPADEGAGAAEADPVRLVALDMMLSGSSREEVRDHLAATFGEGDREAVLDEVFTQYGD